MIPFSLYIKEYSWSYDQKYYKFSYYFLYIYSSLNLKYLKLTKMELSRFAMKLFKCIWESELSTCNLLQTLTIALLPVW